MKCKAPREMKDPKQVTLGNGRIATKGICPKCGTTMYRMGKGSGKAAEKAAPAPAPEPKAKNGKGKGKVKVS
jgi:hypothetical protein